MLICMHVNTDGIEICLKHYEAMHNYEGMITNGFVFESTDTAGLDYALNRAMATWYTDKSGFRQIQVGYI